LADQVIPVVVELFAKIGIPRDLAAMGMPANQLAWSAEQAFAAKRLINNNPRSLDRASLTAILQASFSGDRQALRDT
jgi:alcohol dehydrogenase